MTGDDVAHIQRRGDRGKWWSKGQPRQILGAPQHDSTRALIAAAPALAKRRQPLATGHGHRLRAGVAQWPGDRTESPLIS